MPITGLAVERRNSKILRRVARLRLGEGQWKQTVSKASARVYLEVHGSFSLCLDEEIVKRYETDVFRRSALLQALHIGIMEGFYLIRSPQVELPGLGTFFWKPHFLFHLVGAWLQPA